MSELKRTPLYEIYEAYGAKTIDFGGWDLPVQFSSILEEHTAVRTRAGLFDVSHMGEVSIHGKDAEKFLQRLLTNDVSKLKTEQAQYTAMCYEDGGTVDDLLVYRQGEDAFLLVVNAANIEKDVAWLKDHRTGDVTIENISAEVAQLAFQGPFAERILQTITTQDLREIRFFRFKDQVEIAGVTVLISRTGYTGEDGFEIYCRSSDAAQLWNAILDAGKQDNVLPCGLGARDTLRFEAKLALYGQELTQEISPLEAGIGFAVKLDKQEAFIGKAALEKQKESGLKKKIVGIEMLEKGIPRHGYDVFADGEIIGHVTSGTQSPTLKKNVGLALLHIDYAELGTEVEVQIRTKRLKAKVVSTPFYRRN